MGVPISLTWSGLRHVEGKLSGTIDLFNKKTNILIDLPAPLWWAVQPYPNKRGGSCKQGYQLTLGWNDRIGEVGYRVNGNFSFVNNKVTKFKGDERTISGTNMIQEGHRSTCSTCSRWTGSSNGCRLGIGAEMIDNAPLDDNGVQKSVCHVWQAAKRRSLYKDLNRRRGQ